MTEVEEIDLGEEDPAELIEKNGLSKLFANRVRARFIVTLFYADDPLTIPEIADSVGMSQTVTHQAKQQLQKFDIMEQVNRERDGEEAFRLHEDDELVTHLRQVAELATDRHYQ